MNGRVYDPAIARFISADPLIQDPYHSQAFNRYSYVWNNPLNGTDPTGNAVQGSDGAATQCASSQNPRHKCGEVGTPGDVQKMKNGQSNAPPQSGPKPPQQQQTAASTSAQSSAGQAEANSNSRRTRTLQPISPEEITAPDLEIELPVIVVTGKGQFAQIPADVYNLAIAYLKSVRGLQKAGDKEKYGRQWNKDGTVQDAKEIPGSNGDRLCYTSRAACPPQSKLPDSGTNKGSAASNVKVNAHLHPDDSDYDHKFSTPDSHLAEKGAYVFSGNLKGNVSVLLPGMKASSTGRGVTVCSNGCAK
jgi:hypothetical protein